MKNTANIPAVFALLLCISSGPAAAEPPLVDQVIDLSIRAFAMDQIANEKGMLEDLNLTQMQRAEFLQLNEEFNGEISQISREWARRPEQERTPESHQQTFGVVAERFGVRLDSLLTTEQHTRWKQLIFQRAVRRSGFKFLLSTKVSQALGLSDAERAAFEAGVRKEASACREEIESVGRWFTGECERVLTEEQRQALVELTGEGVVVVRTATFDFESLRKRIGLSPRMKFLSNRDLSMELEIVGDQRKQIIELSNQYYHDAARLVHERSRRLRSEKKFKEAQEFPVEEITALRDTTDRALEKILLPDQAKRLTQLVTQAEIHAEGKPRLLTSRVIDALGIDERQQAELTRIVNEANERSKRDSELYARYLESILAVLTVDQRAAYDELTGRRFEFAN